MNKMFGGIPGLANLAQGMNRSQLEFKAGKMEFDGKKVKPDRRKGIIKLT